ncbi:MAG: hypothetical protein IPL41_00655 [Micropruina sp.]|nr:hypothetical protein [Micropruina sp.]
MTAQRKPEPQPEYLSMREAALRIACPLTSCGGGSRRHPGGNPLQPPNHPKSDVPICNA